MSSIWQLGLMNTKLLKSRYNVKHSRSGCICATILFVGQTDKFNMRIKIKLLLEDDIETEAGIGITHALDRSLLVTHHHSA